MPKIPTYDNQQVEARPLAAQPQSTVASPELFQGIAGVNKFGNLGKSLQQTSNEFFDIAFRMQQLDDIGKVTAAESGLVNRMVEYQVEARTRKGQDAVDLIKDADRFYDTTVRELGNGLTERQRFRLKQIAEARRPSFRGDILKWETQQREETARAGIEAQRQASMNAVAQNPMRAAEELQRVKGVTAAESKIMGLDEESGKIAMLDATSRFHIAVMDSLERQSPGMALQYLEVHKQEVSHEALRQIIPGLQAADHDRQAEAITDHYEARIRAGEMTTVQVLDDIGRKYSGDMEKRAKQDFKARIADLDAAREKEQRGAADQAWQIYIETRRLGAIPAGIRQRMDGRDWLALEEAHKRRAEGAAVTTDWDTYYQLRRAAIDNPERFRTADLRRYFSKLGKGEREALIDLQSKAYNDPAALKDVATLEQQLGNARDMMGLTGKNDAEKRGQFDRAVTDAISAEEKRTGKKLNYDERQKVIDHFVIEGKIPGFLWDKTARRFEVAGTENESKFLPMDKEIIRRFRARFNREPTQAELDRTKENLRLQAR